MYTAVRGGRAAIVSPVAQRRAPVSNGKSSEQREEGVGLVLIVGHSQILFG